MHVAWLTTWRHLSYWEGRACIAGMECLRVYPYGIPIRYGPCGMVDEAIQAHLVGLRNELKTILAQKMEKRLVRTHTHTHTRTH